MRQSKLQRQLRKQAKKQSNQEIIGSGVMDDKIEEVESEALKINNKIETPTEPQRVVEEPARPTSDNELDSILSNNDLLNSKIEDKIIAKDNKFYNDAKIKQPQVVVIDSEDSFINKIIIGGIIGSCIFGLGYLFFKYVKSKKQKETNTNDSAAPDILQERSIWEQ